jgi:hypothetical protein
MTKKSFKDSNPALQFISTAIQDDNQTYDTQNTSNADNTSNTYNTHNISNANNTYNKPRIVNAKTREETKSKRLNLLLQPSVVANIEKIAAMKRSSVNDLINSILKRFIVEEADTLTRYDKVFGESIN